MVTGGDVLVSIRAESGANLENLSIEVNGRDVSGDFQPVDDGLLGLISGLDLGENTITVSGADDGDASLTITNHPITGPLFAGPQQQPFICQTEDFVMGEEERLGPAIDEDCSVETRVDYFYRAGDEFLPLTDPSAHPD